jgi:RNA polymerase sigma-70 factor (ECF subfamily)
VNPAKELETSELGEAFAGLRPELLRHCYRMLGSFAEAEDAVQDALLKAWRARESYAGDAPLAHWLMRITTNTCLNRLTRARPRALPQLERSPATVGTAIEELEAATWITPAPDAQLFPDAARSVEAREQVALAFIALLQRLPPKQRAVLLLKDVVGWPAEEIATALELTLSSVNSALHRARETMASRPQARAEEPPPAVLGAYVRSWETGDLETLVSLLRADVAFAMPPHATWFRGAADLMAFLRTPRFTTFWTRGLWAVPTRANGLPAVVWYVGGPEELGKLHSLQVMRFLDGALAEATNFIGPHYLHGFEMPAERAR